MASFELRSWELVCYSFILLIGLLGNSIVILVVMKGGKSPKARLRDVPYNVYLLALAIADLALSFICLPVYIMTTSAFPHPTGVQGDIFCKVVTGGLPQFWLAGVSIYLLVVISFERYAAISKPLKTRLGISRKNYVYIGLAWLLGFTRQVPTLVGIRYTATNATYGNSCYYWPGQRAKILIYSFIFMTQYLAPAVIFLLNFYRIKKRLNRLDGTLKTALGDQRQRIKIMKSKERSIRIVFIVLLTFLVCWTPNNIMFLLFQYGDLSNVKWTSDYYQFSIILGFSSTCLNPFLYAFQSRQFRIHCEKVLKKLLTTARTDRRRVDESHSITTSTGTQIKLTQRV